MSARSYHPAPGGESEPHAAKEAALVAALDETTDRTRRSLGSTVGNALLMVTFIVGPRWPGAAQALGDFDADEGLALSLPGLTCVLLGAWLYRRHGPRHPLYRAVDALELCAFHAFPALFPLLASRTTYMAGALLVASAGFWGQAKPGRARLYGGLIAAVGLAPALLLWLDGHGERAALAASFAVASVLAYAMGVRARQEGVRAEARRDRLREDARMLRVTLERRKIERELTGHVGARLDALATELARANLPEAALARQLSTTVSELVLPGEQAVQLTDLEALVRSRCVTPFPNVTLSPQPPAAPGPPPISPAAARAVLRLAQEFVRNAVTHGRAERVDVAVRFAGDELRLTVSDDGVGLPPSALEHASGGLRNAKEWVRELGGALTVTPRLPSGTKVDVALRGVGSGNDGVDAGVDGGARSGGARVEDVDRGHEPGHL